MGVVTVHMHFFSQTVAGAYFSEDVLPVLGKSIHTNIRTQYCWRYPLKNANKDDEAVIKMKMMMMMIMSIYHAIHS